MCFLFDDKQSIMFPCSKAHKNTERHKKQLFKLRIFLFYTKKKKKFLIVFLWWCSSFFQQQLTALSVCILHGNFTFIYKHKIYVGIRVNMSLLSIFDHFGCGEMVLKCMGKWKMIFKQRWKFSSRLHLNYVDNVLVVVTVEWE
jgi:hypothetical protein